MGAFLDAVHNFFYIAKEKLVSAFVKVKNAMTRFFQKALDMMRASLDKLRTRVRGLLMGSAHFFRKIGDKYQEGTRNYSVDTELGDWNEVTVTRTVGVNDIPPQYRTLDDEFEVDDTKEIDEALSC